MSIFTKMSRGRIRKPFFLCLYSGPGIGKTSAAASFPNPFWFDFEESSHSIDVNRSRPETFTELMDDLEEFRAENVLSDEMKKIDTIVFDTIDELERLIHKVVAEEAKKPSIDHIGWQKGYGYAINHWADFLSLCRAIRDKHGIHFVFLAHAFDSSRTDAEKGLSFSRHSMALHKKAADYIFGQVEMVLFAKKDIAMKKIEDRNVAVDVEKRIIYTSLSAHYDAKNRIGLPHELPMPKEGVFNILSNAYEKAFNETPQSVFKECIDEITQIKDNELRDQMTVYCGKNKTDISILRSTLLRIKKIKGEQK